MTVHLTVAEVVAIHADLIERYGDSPGLRDRGRLEAAVFRPRSGYHPDPIAEAAALWESLAQNHAFVDGNKRVAFAATYTFLKVNGVTITADADATFAFISGLYAGSGFALTASTPGSGRTRPDRRLAPRPTPSDRPTAPPRRPPAPPSSPCT